MNKNFGIPLPFVELLGFEMVRFADGASEIAYNIRPEHCNSFGVAHGGAIMTLMDVPLATAACSPREGMSVVTIEMKTVFTQLCRCTVTGRGRLLHQSGRMAFCEASILDSGGALYAHGTGIFKYVPLHATT